MSITDERRFETLIEPHLDALFRTAYRLARNRADAEDLVQETCVRACVRIGELDESQSVKAWLFRVLHNLFVDETRRSNRAQVTGAIDDLESAAPCTNQNPEESADATEREEEMQHAWSQLERDQRVLLALRAEGYTLTEIAANTGLTKQMVNARLYRARQSFSRYLHKEQGFASTPRLEIAK